MSCGVAMIAKNLKALLKDIPDDAQVYIAGVACSEDIAGCIRSRSEPYAYMLLAKMREVHQDNEKPACSSSDNTYCLF